VTAFRCSVANIPWYESHRHHTIAILDQSTPLLSINIKKLGSRRRRTSKRLRLTLKLYPIFLYSHRPQSCTYYIVIRRLILVGCDTVNVVEKAKRNRQWMGQSIKAILTILLTALSALSSSSTQSAQHYPSRGPSYPPGIDKGYL